MIPARISLNGGDWLLKDFVGEDWVWRNAEKPDTADVRWWRPASVPGTVLHDLLANGEVPDPYVERNSLLVEWVPQRTWVYRKTFEAPADCRGRRVKLHFKGVDYAAQFFLNGRRLGAHEGMYTPAEFEVGELLNAGGSNLLAVVVEKAPDEQPQVSKTAYVRTHKSRMTYWWDFCPRMIHQGIWDEVYLDVSGPAAIEDVYVRPVLADDCARADVEVETALSVSAAVRARVKAVLRDAGGRRVAEHTGEHALGAGETTLRLRLPVERPKLWQPNGSAPEAEAYRYEAEVRVYVAAGAEADGGEAGPGTDPASMPAVPELSAARTVPFGIRKVAFARNEGADPSARPYTLVVNGRRTYVKGWNWVPLDAMYGVERPAKLERLLTLAKRAGVNMLRVWGGGLIEKDAFYELCSRYGIMVWQEFVQSSSGIADKPSEAPEFLAMMAREAEAIVPRKRNHASLVLWCGGNELQDAGNRPLDDGEPVLGLLRAAVERLHPDALWLPTSPTGRVFMNSLETIARDPDGLHDVHGPWEHQGLAGHYELYNNGTSLLHSEFGVEGMTNRRALDRTIPPERQWPATKDNPVYFHRGAWWINEPLVQRSFGEALGDVGTLIRASQFLQAEGLRYAVESSIRRQPRSSGTLPWQLNEPYPNAYCTSAIDYDACPKPAYYAVARAYRPVAVTAAFAAQAWAGRDAFAAELWAASSLPRAADGARAAWSLAGASGRVYAAGETAPAALPDGGAVRLGAARCPLADIGEDAFVLTLSLADAGGRPLAGNRYVFSAAGDLTPLLRVPETTLHARLLPAEDAAPEAASAAASAAGASALGGAARPAHAAARAAAAPVRARLELVNAGEAAALNVRLDEPDGPADPNGPSAGTGYAYFEDNGFTLLPGERRAIAVDWHGVPDALRGVAYSAWNAPAAAVLLSSPRTFD
ncbi:beta-mannosidase [Paenibacillus sp. UNC496MF]|uniref:glycoside hydrolase family 2 protein n=1 Tax=Paenibacillus sp. UNC496MF TaxID=1502753 RepID=UPI0008DF93AC|nr:sugar-binding domain-containing protein [Paenibacillus sp. UNC496MF]SFI76116.1 beta-mannosidase [Paenibacillus sp. UNC496MF]